MRLKVFGTNYAGKFRRIVAASSQAKAAALIGVSLSDFRTFGCQTGNATEIELAMREPGVVWQQSNNGYNAPWERVG